MVIKLLLISVCDSSDVSADVPLHNVPLSIFINQTKPNQTKMLHLTEKLPKIFWHVHFYSFNTISHQHFFCCAYIYPSSKLLLCCKQALSLS